MYIFYIKNGNLFNVCVCIFMIASEDNYLVMIMVIIKCSQSLRFCLI